MDLSLPLPKFDLVRAAGALGKLLRNPDDLPQVFTLIDAISGTAPHRLLWGFRRDATGTRLLRERPDIAPLLSDRDALRKLPDGSLGRAYLAFVESEGISADGIRAASKEGIPVRTDAVEMLYVKERMRDTHDLWHAVTGYKGDVLGEIGLLAFSLAQHWNTGVAFIVGATLFRRYGVDTTPAIREGHRRGRAAKWLPALDWEALLPRPLDQVRAELHLEAPPVYKPVRTSELREQGLLT